MLFDDLLQWNGGKAEPRFSIAPYLKKEHQLETAQALSVASHIAHKFRFNNDSARLASSFIFTDPAEEFFDSNAVVKLKPLCRLPFRTVWIEYPELPRLGMNSTWGFLAEESLNGDIIVSGFQGYKGSAVLSILFSFDPTKTEMVEHEDRLLEIAFGEIVDGDAKDNRLVQGAAITVAQITALLAFINSPAIVELAPINDDAAKNARRAKDGKKKLHAYHEIRIKKEVREAMKQENLSDDHEGRRLHWKRGHFKQRKTGLFWWKPHLAGRKELGFIEKDYKI